MWSDNNYPLNSDHFYFLDLETNDHLLSPDQTDFTVLQPKNYKKDSLNKKYLNKNSTFNYENQNLNNQCFSLNSNNNYNQLIDLLTVQNKGAINTLASTLSPTNNNWSLDLLKQKIDPHKSLFDWNSLWSLNKERQSKCLYLI